MTYDIPIKVKDAAKSWAIFDWCHAQRWEIGKDYNYATPTLPNEKWDYKFKFRRSEDATMFALRWA